MGRPPLPDRHAKFRQFIERIEQGDTLKQALQDAGIAWGSVARWITDDTNTLDAQDTDWGRDGETYAARYARARVQSGAFYADKAQEAVEAAVDSQSAQVARVKADVYKWRAGVADPKGYGERKGDVNVSVSLGALHLDALRRVSATAKLSDPNTIAQLTSGDTSPRVSEQEAY